MDGVRPLLGDAIWAACHGRGGADLCQAGTVNGSKPQRNTDFDFHEGARLEECPGDEAHANKAESGLGESAFDRMREIADAILGFRAIEAALA